MNATQKWIVAIFAMLLLLVMLLPAWQQKYQGHLLVYNEHLGRHPLWSPPAPTGEDSWMIKAPASQCEVVVNKGLVARQSGIIIAVASILIFGFRGRPVPKPTMKSLVLTSLFVALCLPVPPPDGTPLLIWVGVALLSPFIDSGHVGPWFAPLIAVISLVGYFAVVFLVVDIMALIARRQPTA